MFVGMTDAEAETPILWSPDVNSWLFEKDTDAEKDWDHEEKEETEVQMVGWYHWLNGHDFEQTLGECDRQGILACCSPWGRRKLNSTEWLNNNKSKGVKCKQYNEDAHACNYSHNIKT